MADEYRMFVAGRWTASEGGATFEATSPSTGEVIGTVPQGTRGGRFSMERLTELKTIVVDLS